MTLQTWSDAYAHPIREHQSGALYVMCDCAREPGAYRELFWLTDFVVSTISGPVVWLMPKRS